jgi:hypothetical protein
MGHGVRMLHLGAKATVDQYPPEFEISSWQSEVWTRGGESAAQF